MGDPLTLETAAPTVVEFALSTERWRLILYDDKTSVTEVNRGPDALGCDIWLLASSDDWATWTRSPTAVLAAAIRAYRERCPEPVTAPCECGVAVLYHEQGVGSCTRCGAEWPALGPNTRANAAARARRVHEGHTTRLAGILGVDESVHTMEDLLDLLEDREPVLRRERHLAAICERIAEGIAGDPAELARRAVAVEAAWWRWRAPTGGDVDPPWREATVLPAPTRGAPTVDVEALLHQQLHDAAAEFLVGSVPSFYAALDRNGRPRRDLAEIEPSGTPDKKTDARQNRSSTTPEQESPLLSADHGGTPDAPGWPALFGALARFEDADRECAPCGCSVLDACESITFDDGARGPGVATLDLHCHGCGERLVLGRAAEVGPDLAAARATALAARRYIAEFRAEASHARSRLTTLIGAVETVRDSMLECLAVTRHPGPANEMAVAQLTRAIAAAKGDSAVEAVPSGRIDWQRCAELADDRRISAEAKFTTLIGAAESLRHQLATAEGNGRFVADVARRALTEALDAAKGDS